jgi:single stranded DNA-binding protein
MINLTAIGNLGKDAKVIGNETRKAITFSIACTDKYFSQNEWKEKTTWLTCELWQDASKSLKLIDFLKKGQPVAIAGSAELRKYETKEGIKGSDIVVNISRIKLLNSGQAPAQQASTETPQEPQYSPEPF